MIFNKGYITAFSKQKPFVALASKGKILDSKFTLTSELSLYDYGKDIHYPVVQTDTEYCKLMWCEKDGKTYLVTGHANGSISLWEPDCNVSFRLIKTFDGLSGDVMAIDYNVSKNVICAGTTTGSIIFWNLDKIDNQYKLDIPIQESISCLSWNKKVSRILCVGTTCGKILVLDIRAKKIALTIQNKDITNVNDLVWHPTCSTSIFAGTNMKNTVCFKLDANSMTHIGHHDREVIGVEVLNKITIVSYTENKIDYIDVDTLKVVESIGAKNICYMSFSDKDPIYCSTFVDGKTEICSKMCENMLPYNVHIQLNNQIVSKNNYKIDDFVLEIAEKNNFEKSVIDLLYRDSEFTLRSKHQVGSILLDEAIKEFGIQQDLNDVVMSNQKLELQNSNTKKNIFFNLLDDVIINLIKQDFEALRNNKERNIPLSFYIENMYMQLNNEYDDSVLFLLDLINKKNYSTLLERVDIRQYKVIIAILLYSYLQDDVIQECITNILAMCKDPLLNLLINKPKEYFCNKSKQIQPSSIFEIRDFFKNYKSDIEMYKVLSSPVSDDLSYEYFWFAKDHGLYETLKSFKYNDKTIKVYLNQDMDEVKSISTSTNSDSSLENNVGLSAASDASIGLKKILPSTLKTHTQTSFTSNKIPTPSYTHTASNLRNSPSVLQKELSTKVSNLTVNPSTLRPSSILSKKSSLHQNSTPKPSLYSVNANSSSTSFATKPQMKSPVLPPSINKVPSTPDARPTTYGQVLNNASAVSSYSMPKMSSPSSLATQHKVDQPLDTSVIIKEFEQLYESLKQTATKKSNLIIGNKIKDANRRFAIFQQLDKTSLSLPIVDYMKDILEVVKSDKPKGDIKNEVRNIVDMCVDIGSNQCDIWMPAVSILVQIVY